MKKIGTRIATAIRKPPIATALAVWASLIALVNGGSMVLNPSAYLESPVYVTAMHIATPFAWGALFIVAGLIILASLSKGSHEAQLPLLVLVVICSLLGVTTIGATLSGEVPSPTWLWVGIAGFTFIAQWACRDEVKPHDSKATDSIR